MVKVAKENLWLGLLSTVLKQAGVLIKRVMGFRAVFHCKMFKLHCNFYDHVAYILRWRVILWSWNCLFYLIFCRFFFSLPDFKVNPYHVSRFRWDSILVSARHRTLHDTSLTLLSTSYCITVYQDESSCTSCWSLVSHDAYSKCDKLKLVIN